jgi:acyl-CoA synthetase (AMP-forming)/AMP-acid ligase II
VLDPDRDATPDELRDHVAARLERFKVPKAITFRTTPLPRTPSGKLLRREI